METYRKLRRGFFKGMAGFAIAVMTALTLVVIWQMLARYLMSEDNLAWFFAFPGTVHVKGVVDLFVTLGKSSEELAMALMIWVGFVGATIGFDMRAHLGVDIFYHIADPSSKKVMVAFSWILVIVFAVLILILGGGEMLIQAFERGNMLKTIDMCRGYVYIPIPLCGVIITYLAIEQLISIFTGIDFKGEPPAVELPASQTETTEGAE